MLYRVRPDHTRYRTQLFLYSDSSVVVYIYIFCGCPVSLFSFFGWHSCDRDRGRKPVSAAALAPMAPRPTVHDILSRCVSFMPLRLIFLTDQVDFCVPFSYIIDMSWQCRNKFLFRICIWCFILSDISFIFGYIRRRVGVLERKHDTGARHTRLSRDSDNT